MSKKVFSSPLRHEEEGHAILTEEAHIKAHGGDAVAAGYTKEEKLIETPSPKIGTEEYGKMVS